jgi:hypothetical protein
LVCGNAKFMKKRLKLGNLSCNNSKYFVLSFSAGSSYGSLFARASRNHIWTKKNAIPDC